MHSDHSPLRSLSQPFTLPALTLACRVDVEVCIAERDGVFADRKPRVERDMIVDNRIIDVFRQILAGAR
jgi:hypothetical protein